MERLRNWPPVPAEDEARIVAAFEQALRSSNGTNRNAGAWGLGHRGHGEAIPLIFKLGQQDSNLIGCFFQLYASGRQMEVPIRWFRRGLRSKNAEVRREVLAAIARYGAITLRAEVEKALEGISRSVQAKLHL